MRGYREKGLYKSLQKHKDVISKAMYPKFLQECERWFKSLLESMQNSRVPSSGDFHVKKNSVLSEKDSKMEVSSEEGGSDERVKMDVSSEDGVTMEESSKQEQTQHKQTSGEEANRSENDRESPSLHKTSEAYHSEPLHDTNKKSTSQCTNSSSPIPESGVYDPMFLEYSAQAEIQVLEYLESIQDRLITAALNREVKCLLCLSYLIKLCFLVCLFVCLLIHRISVLGRNCRNS